MRIWSHVDESEGDDEVQEVEFDKEVRGVSGVVGRKGEKADTGGEGCTWNSRKEGLHYATQLCSSHWEPSLSHHHHHHQQESNTQLRLLGLRSRLVLSCALALPTPHL